MVARYGIALYAIAALHPLSATTLVAQPQAETTAAVLTASSQAPVNTIAFAGPNGRTITVSQFGPIIGGIVLDGPGFADPRAAAPAGPSRGPQAPDQVDGPVGAVPEPASWAMMIAGFGLAGAAMRRRARRSFAHF